MVSQGKVPHVWETLVLGRAGSVSIRPAFVLWMLVQNSGKGASKQARLPAQLCVCRRALSLALRSSFRSRLWRHFQAAPSQEHGPKPPRRPADPQGSPWSTESFCSELPPGTSFSFRPLGPQCSLSSDVTHACGHTWGQGDLGVDSVRLFCSVVN